MKKIWMAWIILCWAAHIEAQNYYSGEDSILQTTPLSGQDWMIALTLATNANAVRYDSTGAPNREPDGCYILSYRNNRYTLERLIQDDWSAPLQLIKTKSITKKESILCINNTDSILQAEDEFLYPNIYYDDSIKVYQAMHNGSHMPTFSISFKTVNFYKTHLFDEVQVYNRPPIFKATPKNLNETHNKSTFMYRSFIGMIRLIRQQFGIKEFDYE